MNQNVFHVPSRSRWQRVGLAVMAAALLVAALPTRASAQDTVAVRRHIYGFSDTTFILGAYLGCTVSGAGLDALWGFANAMGLNLIRKNIATATDVMTMDTSSLRGTRKLIVRPEQLDNAGYGTEVQFYPFDSAQSPYFACKFLHWAGGLKEANTDQIAVNGRYPDEMTYDNTNTTAGQKVCDSVVFDWNPKQIYRFPRSQYDDSAQNADAYLLEEYPRLLANDKYTSIIYYIVATGHLFYPTSSLPDDSSVLKIEVYYEVPKGVAFIDSTMPLFRYLPSGQLSDTSITGPITRAYAPTPVFFRSDASTNAQRKFTLDSLADSIQYRRTDTTNDKSFLYKTLYVTKGQLERTSTSIEQGTYYSPSLALNLQRCDTCRPGPLFPGQTSKRINMKVYWLGGEKLALRSIAIRDTLGELVLGVDSAYRHILNVEAHTALRDASGDLRQSVVRLDVGNEPSHFEYAPFAAVETMIKGFHNVGDDEGDSVQAWIEGVRYGNHAVVDHWHHVTDASIVSVEIGMNYPVVRDTVLRNDSNVAIQPDGFGRRWPKLPSIKEHNGLRFNIPLLRLTPGDIRDYEQVLQTLAGRYIPGEYAREFSDWSLSWTAILGRGARTALRTGRRFLSIPFCAVETYIDPYVVSGTAHHTIWMPHIPEPSELRLMTNLSLAYGVHGIYWYWLGSTANEGTAVTVDGVSTFRYYTDLGSNGPFTNDTLRDWSAAYLFKAVADPTGVTVDSFYVGFRARTRELRALHTWLQQLGPTLMRLQWRDAYSMHFSQRDPATYDTLEPSGRPLPSTEIITDVKSYPLGSTTPDSVLRTYVELGLFEPRKADTAGGAIHGYDTQYVFVVNRRGFEAPDGWVKKNPQGTDSIELISAARRDTMLQLTESRRILLKLNIPHPDTSQQYVWYRVREKSPELIPLPGTTENRQALDTIVHGSDSAVAVFLRPGAGTLLEIFPVGPDTNIYTGGLAYNNARSMIFDGSQYHCAYVRFDTSGPSARVMYRRSIPVSPENASILWEPTEWILSSHVDAFDTSAERVENRTPSLTLRMIDGSTVISATWSCFWMDGQATNRREIVQRSFNFPEGAGAPDFGPIETVDTYYGSRNSEWGTVVVSRLATGNIFAYSDSVAGIVARYQPVITTPDWWRTPMAYSPRHIVDGYALMPSGSRIQFPTMPPFAHITALDSNVGIAWQSHNGSTGYSNIYYKRLWVVADTLTHNNLIRLNEYNGLHRHPSMDMWQDVWWHAYEGVVWEEQVRDDTDPLLDYTIIHFQPLATRARSYDSNAEGNVTVHWDHHDSTTTGQWTKVSLDGNRRYAQTPDYAWPSTASMNEVVDTEHQYDTNHFAVAWVDSTEYNDADTSWEEPTSVHQMMQWHVYFGSSLTVDGYPHDYQYDGYRPSQSSSPVRQDLRAGVLYTKTKPVGGNGVITTSRQFFGKARPRGYLAEGRSLVLRVDDSTQTTLRVRMLDAWYADDTVASPLPLKPRGPSSQMVDSLAQVDDLFETIRFTTHDSVTIGFEVAASFSGDSTIGASAEIYCRVQLVDSATNAVVQVLDSFGVSAVDTIYHARVESECDLLSGTYYVRLVVDTIGFVAEPSVAGSHYPVDELFRRVESEELYGKVRRLGRGVSGATARLDLHPNPSAGMVEVRFSVPGESRVTVRVVDQRGMEAVVPVRTTTMEAGRYAVGFDGSRLAPGVYLVELRAGKERVVEKVVITR